MADVGERVRRIRKAAGLRQIDLAKKIHMTQSYIAGIENHSHNPSLSTLQLIADALHVDISEFIGNVNSIQETGMSTDEINLVMSYRDLTEYDRTTVQNLVSSLRLANRQIKSARSISMPITGKMSQKIKCTGMVSGRV